jgi:RNA polymerase sigma-70 factor (ECF subfamily)
MLRNQDDAEDLTQEVFLQVFRKASTFRGESQVSTWLHRLTINIVLMHLRKQHRRPFPTAPLDGSLSAEGDNSGVNEVVSTCQASSTSTFDRMSLEIAMAQLSSGYRTIFVLHDVEGYGHEEIAKLLGISEGTSKSQLHRARHRLRELLDKGRGNNPCGSVAPAPRCGARKRKCLSRVVHFATV